MGDWINRQWKDISGNFKFWLLAKIFGGGSALTTFAYLYASLFIVSTVLFLISDRRLAGLSPTSRVTDTGPPSMAPLVAMHATAYPQKLNIEVLGGFIGRWTENGDLFGFSELRILLILRAAPTTDPGVGVKRWEIQYSDHYQSDQWATAEIKSIPEYLQYAAKLSGDIDDTPRRVVPAIVPLTYRQKILYGSHAEGAVWATIYGDNVHKFFRYSFRVSAVDSLDTESDYIQGPGEWLRPATFSIGEPPAPVFPRYLAPPPTFQ
jgi:hypothetical protein